MEKMARGFKSLIVMVGCIALSTNLYAPEEGFYNSRLEAQLEEPDVPKESFWEGLKRRARAASDRYSRFKDAFRAKDSSGESSDLNTPLSVGSTNSSGYVDNEGARSYRSTSTQSSDSTGTTATPTFNSAPKSGVRRSSVSSDSRSTDQEMTTLGQGDFNPTLRSNVAGQRGLYQGDFDLEGDNEPIIGSSDGDMSSNEPMIRSSEGGLSSNDSQPTTSSRSMKDSATLAVKNAVDWLNSTKIVQWFNRIGNSGRDSRAASRVASNLASSASPDFTDHLKNLTIKEKQAVANLWVKARLVKIQDIEKRLKTAETTRYNTRENLETLRAQVKEEKDLLKKDMRALAEKIQSTLPSTEVIIPLEKGSDELFNPTAITSLDNNVFEIVDMTKINPKVSISQQYGKLTRSGFFGLGDADVSYSNPNVLLNQYSSWVVRNITIDPSQPILGQLESESEKLLGTNWSSLDGSIKSAIFLKLGKDIQQSFNNDADTKVKQNIEQYNKELQQEFLNMSPDDLSKAYAPTIGTLNPETIAQLSKEQIQALTSDQVQALTKEQIQALNSHVTYLTPDQIRSLRDVQIQSLKPSQIDALTSEQIASITPDQLNAMSTGYQISLFTKEQIQSLTSEQLQSIISRLSGRQKKLLSGAQLNSLGISDDSNSINLRDLSDEQIAQINPEKIPGLSLDDTKFLYDHIKTLTPEQISRLTGEQIGSMRFDQIKLLKAEQLKALTTQQLSSMNGAQIRSFTNDQINDLTKEQFKDIFDRLSDSQRQAVI